MTNKLHKEEVPTQSVACHRRTDFLLINFRLLALSFSSFMGAMMLLTKEPAAMPRIADPPSRTENYPIQNMANYFHLFPVVFRARLGPSILIKKNYGFVNNFGVENLASETPWLSSESCQRMDTAEHTEAGYKVRRFSLQF